ncbi:NrdH-redoxin [Rhodococcus hoagii]|nr:NrdH-redoxin [Prescottella equi]
MIYVYSQSACLPCKQVKDLLNSKGLAFVEYNITEDDAAYERLTRELQRNSAPTVVFADGYVAVGLKAVQAKVSSLS